MSENINLNNDNNKNNNNDVNIIIKDDNNQQKPNINSNPQKNHFIQSFLSDKTTNIIILSLLPIIIITEIFYRTRLFNLSLIVEENIQNFMGSKDSTIIKIFKILTDFGGGIFTVIGIVIVYLFFSIVETFTYIFGIVFCLYIHLVMKMWYGNLRPYWEKSSLYMGGCDGTFGNPSGHSFISFFLYLTLLHYVLDHKYIKNKNILKIFLIIIFLLWTVMVAISRIILGVHSINQILYGGLLGIWVFLCIIYVFRCDKMTARFYRKFYREKKYIIFFPSYVIICLVVAIISNFTVNQNLNYDDLNEKMNVNCSAVKEYKRFNYGCLTVSMFISAILGLYCGQYLFWYLIDKKYKKMNLIEDDNKGDNNNENDVFNEEYYFLDELINKWSSYRSLLFKPWWNIFKAILVLILCAIPLIMMLAMPENINGGLIMTFKIAVPIFIICFLVFSIGLYEVVFITCGKKEVLLSCGNENEKLVK